MIFTPSEIAAYRAATNRGAKQEGITSANRICKVCGRRSADLVKRSGTGTSRHNPSVWCCRGYYVRKTKTAPLVSRQIVEPDWAGMVRELNRRGYAKGQVALAAGCTREMVYSMLRGNTPPWTIGAALLLLHETVRSESDE